MRITFVLPPVSLSGGIRVVAIYAERLQARGHQVVLVSPPQPSISIKQRTRRLLKTGSWSAPLAEGSHLDGLPLDHRVLDRYRPVQAGDVPDADVIIATWWETAEWVAKLPPQKGVGIHFVQGHEVFPPQPVERVKAAYALPLKKITISHWLVDLLRREYGCDHPVRVPNSVDMDQFHAPARNRQTTPTVGLLYSRHPVKGCDVSLHALEQVKRKMPELHLLAFGAMHPTDDLPLPQWAEFHFRPPQDQIRNLYAACDVWLCGSRSEGFHLPPLEAMACRCPVVSTRVGGPMDVIRDGENGYLVDIGDSDSLARQLAEVLNLNESDWRRMSNAAHATAVRYSWDDATDLLERTLENAVEDETRTVMGGLTAARVST